MVEQSPLWRRLLGFTLLPAIAAVSPLLVLPVVARVAGDAGWASAIAGESVGTVAAIAIGYGWTAIGPALVSLAADDRERGAIYRGSIVVRLVVAAIALPAMAVICWLVAVPGSQWLSVLMGLQGALIALSFTWYSAGTGDPRSIVVYDAVPRLVVAVLAAVAIVNTGFVELYPLSGIGVTLVGTALFTFRVLRRNPAPWPGAGDVKSLFRTGAPVALNDAALSAYSSVPSPLVTVTASPAAAAGYASADKLLKLGQFLPLTLANALQSWIAEVHGAARSRRMRLALWSHGLFGVLGWVVLGVAGSWVSLVLFDTVTPVAIVVTLGLVFALFSIRTSMTRHVLFPAGEAHAVMRATLIATAVGVPAMVVLAVWTGPLGAALGYALAEGVATVLLVPRSIRSLHELDRTEPIHP